MMIIYKNKKKSDNNILLLMAKTQLLMWSCMWIKINLYGWISTQLLTYDVFFVLLDVSTSGTSLSKNEDNLRINLKSNLRWKSVTNHEIFEVTQSVWSTYNSLILNQSRCSLNKCSTVSKKLPKITFRKTKIIFYFYRATLAMHARICMRDHFTYVCYILVQCIKFIHKLYRIRLHVYLSNRRLVGGNKSIFKMLMIRL